MTEDRDMETAKALLEKWRQDGFEMVGIATLGGFLDDVAKALREARAEERAEVFTALEQPSEGMLDAAKASGPWLESSKDEDGNWYDVHDYEPDAVWRAMLERAKREMLG